MSSSNVRSDGGTDAVHPYPGMARTIPLKVGFVLFQDLV